MIDHKQVANNFSKSSMRYDDVALCQQYSAGKFASLIASSVVNRNSVRKILDVGCGTGFLSKILMGLFPHAEFILTDLSQQMLDVCACNTEKIREDHDIDALFMVHDISSDPIFGEFDLIVSSMALQWLERDLEVVLNKLKMALSANGRLMFTTLVDGTFKRLKWCFDELSIDYPGLNLYSEDELKLLCAGYAHLSFEVYSDCYPNVMTFLRQLKQTGAVNATGKRVSMTDLRKVISLYQSSCLVDGDVLGEYNIAYCIA